MVKLIKNNVVKIVDTEEKKAKLVEQGFKVVEVEDNATKKAKEEVAKKEAAEKKATEKEAAEKKAAEKKATEKKATEEEEKKKAAEGE